MTEGGQGGKEESHGGGFMLVVDWRRGGANDEYG
jgi:hypothetical protein